MRIWGIVFLSLVFVACAPSQASISTAIAETQAAVPTQTPAPTSTVVPTLAPTPTVTPIPLADLDLVPLLVQSGDLPAGVGTGQVLRGIDIVARGMPDADYAIRLQFSKDEEGLGAVTVWLYAKPEIVIEAYREQSGRLMELDDFELVADIGDHAVGVPPAVSAARALEASGLGSYMDSLIGELVFVRCHAVVHIALPYSTGNLIPMASYARALDERLAPVVCRGGEPFVTEAEMAIDEPTAFEGEGRGTSPVFYLVPGQISVRWSHPAEGSYFVTLRQEGSSTGIKVAEGSGHTTQNIRLEITEAANYYFNVNTAGGSWMVEITP